MVPLFDRKTPPVRGGVAGIGFGDLLKMSFLGALIFSCHYISLINIANDTFVFFGPKYFFTLHL